MGGAARVDAPAGVEMGVGMISARAETSPAGARGATTMTGA